MAKFRDLLGYPAIIAFRNRIAENCEAEDAVKGNKESSGLIESAVLLLRGVIRTIKSHSESSTQEPLSDESPVLPWLVEHAGCILSRCQKGRDRKTPFERLHAKKPTQEFVPFGEKVLAKQLTTDPMNRMNPRLLFGIWLGMRVDPIPIPPLPLVGARIQRERITKKDIDELGATIGCPGCNQGQQRCTSPLRSLQKANRRMPQNHSTWSRKIGSKK